MLLRKCGKKNLENYQLPRWSLPKDYSDFGFVSGNIFILFSIYILLPFPYSDPTPLSVRTWLAVLHISVSTRAEPVKTKVAFIIELDRRFVIAADLHISLKLYFYEKPTLPACKNYHSFLPMWLLEILYVLWTNITGKELKKKRIIPFLLIILCVWSCDTGSQEAN